MVTIRGKKNSENNEMMYSAQDSAEAFPKGDAISAK